MSATAVAAAGAAVAYYFYTWRRRGTPQSETPKDVETHVRAHREPNTWMEALYFFAEGLRYAMGQE